MLRLYEKVRNIVMCNWRGPQVYLLPIYNYYYALLSDKVMPLIEKIFTQSILPELPVSNTEFLKNSILYFDFKMLKFVIKIGTLTCSSLKKEHNKIVFDGNFK